MSKSVRVTLQVWQIDKYVVTLQICHIWPDSSSVILSCYILPPAPAQQHQELLGKLQTTKKAKNEKM